MNEGQEQSPLIQEKSQDEVIPRLVKPEESGLLLPPEGFAFLEQAGAQVYEKTRPLVVPQLPTKDEMIAHGMSSERGYYPQLEQLYKFLNGYAITDKFGSDHASRREWRLRNRMSNITQNELKSVVDGYKQERIDHKRPITQEEYNEILQRLEGFTDVQFTVDGFTLLSSQGTSQILEDFIPALRARMVDPVREELVKKAYEDINQFRGNRLNDISAGLQFIGHKLFLQNGNAEAKAYLKEKGLALRDLVYNPDDEEFYPKKDNAEKLSIVRKYEDVTAEVLPIILPKELQKESVKVTVT